MATSLSFEPRVPVFDANVCVGDGRKEASPCRTRRDLITEMDRHRVQRALIYHAQTEEGSSIVGNECLQTWLGDDGRLIPQWSVLPTDDSVAQVQALHDRGRAKCVRLRDTHSVGLPFRSWAYDPLLSWLGESQIPLWIPLPESDAHELVTTLQGYPELVTVLVGAHYTHALWVRPLLRALPNASLELSRYECIGEVEALRDEFGAERLLYGSWYPRYAMGPVLYYLHRTDLSDAELTMVCASNLKRILRTGESDCDWGNRDH